jgi:hypothetical protein
MRYHGEDDSANHPEHQYLISGELLVDLAEVTAGHVTDGSPHPDPGRCTQRVESQKPPPRHTGNAGHDAIELAQAVDESGDADDLPAVACEEVFSLGEALFGHKDVSAEAKDQPPATEMPDQVTDVIAGDSREETQHRDPDDIEPAGSGEHPSSHQHGLAGNRRAKALDEQKTENRQVTVRVEDRDQPREHPRQLWSHPTTSPVTGRLDCAVRRQHYPLTASRLGRRSARRRGVWLRWAPTQIGSQAQLRRSEQALPVRRPSGRDLPAHDAFRFTEEMLRCNASSRSDISVGSGGSASETISRPRRLSSMSRSTRSV